MDVCEPGMRALAWTVLVIVLIVAASVALTLLSTRDQGADPLDLPWQIERLADGGSRVFGVELGVTPLQAFVESRREFPELGLFSSSAGELTLEAYFGRLRLGILDARIILTLDVPEARLAEYAARRVGEEPMPSGARRYTLTDADARAAFAAPIARITYVPYADYDAPTVRKRFGDPAEVVEVDETQRYWFYPEQGLILLLADEGRDALEYVAPRDFAAAAQRARERALSATGARG
jgi:hypothetical protein